MPTKGKLFIVTIKKSTAGGWINPGKYLLRVGSKMQHGKRHWNVCARCFLDVPLESDEKGYPIGYEREGFGIEKDAINEIIPVEEYVVKNAAGRAIHWCRISSAQVAELGPIMGDDKRMRSPYK